MGKAVSTSNILYTSLIMVICGCVGIRPSVSLSKQHFLGRHDAVKSVSASHPLFTPTKPKPSDNAKVTSDEEGSHDR